MASGIFAQSVGGGGGIGGSVGLESSRLPATGSSGTRDLIAAGLAAGKALPSLAAELATFGAPYQSLSISIAGEGGAAGNGGNVLVTNNGSIFTKGVLSFGVFAQSVGGGGGMGGAGSLTPSQIAIPMAGGRGGDGGNVTVIHTGDIVTEGYGAIGIFAQSVGGGGGYAGDLSFGVGEFVSPSVPLPIGSAGGDGGDVTVTSTGNISVSGVGAFAIFAQSVGGGGGLWNGQGILGSAGSLGLEGQAGKVEWSHTGDLVAPDVNGVAALFQSQGTDGQDDIIATLDGDIRGGSIFGKGIMVDGGENNLLTLFGSVASESQLAIEATTGNDTINSHSMVLGNIDLNGGGITTSSVSSSSSGRLTTSAVTVESNVYNNLADATLIAIDYIDLGAGGVLNNDGVVTFDTSSGPRTVALTGSLTQNASGELVFNNGLSQSGQQFDRLNISGTANLAGVITVQIPNPSALKTGSVSSTLLQAGGGVIDNGVSFNNTAVNSAAAAFDIDLLSDEIVLNYTLDFAGINGDLNSNRTSFGNYLNEAVNAGGNTDITDLSGGLFFIPTSEELGEAYDALNGTIYADAVAEASFAGERFADALLSCQQNGQALGAGCAWAKFGFREQVFDETFENGRTRSEVIGLSAGVETSLTDKIYAGFGIARDLTDSFASEAGTSGKRTSLGVHIGAALDQTRIGLYGIYSDTDNDVDRVIAAPTSSAIARGGQEVKYYELGAELAGKVEGDVFYVQNSLRLGYVSIDQNAVAETASTGLALAGEKTNSEFFRAVSDVQIGTSFEAGGRLVNPYVIAGLSLDSIDRYGVQLRFADTPAIGSFAQNRFVDRLRADIGLGVVVSTDEFAFHAEWKKAVAGDATSDQLTLGASVRF